MKKIIAIFSISLLISSNINVYASNDISYKNIKQISIKNMDSKIKSEIDIIYPQINNLNNKSIESQINNDIKKIIDSSKNTFLKNIDKTQSNSDLGVNNGLTINYKIHYMDKNKVSILSDMSTYFLGAAHPNNELISFNYDLKTGKKIELKDLFKSNSNYLKTLSDYCIKNLSKKVASYDDDSTWVKNGASPKSDNFKTFTVTQNSLTIHFQTYQVASYAEGPQEVKIPFSVIKNIMK